MNRPGTHVLKLNKQKTKVAIHRRQSQMCVDKLNVQKNMSSMGVKLPLLKNQKTMLSNESQRMNSVHADRVTLVNMNRGRRVGQANIV